MQSSTLVMMKKGTDFLRNNLQSGTDGNSAALRAALLQLCYCSRNFGASPTVAAGSGTGANDDNRMQVVSLMKGIGEGQKANTKTIEELAQATRAIQTRTRARTVAMPRRWENICWRPGGGTYDNNTSNNRCANRGQNNTKGKGGRGETNQSSETATTVSYPSHRR